MGEQGDIIDGRLHCSMRPLLCLATAAILLAAGCLHFRQTTWKLTHADDMKAVVAQHVPPGTPLADAQKFMESEGFECAVKRGKTFIQRVSWSNHGMTQHPNIDFLECERVQGDGSLFMARFWTVALVLHGDEVHDVLVSHYIDGP